MDALQREAGKWGQQRDFSFGWSDFFHTRSVPDI
jgi:hypothetical protein